MGKAKPQPAETPIFNRGDYDQLKEAQRRLHDLFPLLDLGDRCGAACDEMRAAAAEINTGLQQIEADFMTPPPKR